VLNGKQYIWRTCRLMLEFRVYIYIYIYIYTLFNKKKGKGKDIPVQAMETHRVVRG
jgi:hypothetical protein